MTQPPQPPAPPPDMSGGNVFTRKYLGLPGWGWAGLIAAAGVVGFIWYRNHQQSASSNAAPVAAPGPTDTSGLSTDQYEALLAQLRDLQGQPSTPIPAGTPSQPTYAQVHKGQKVNAWILAQQTPGDFMTRWATLQQWNPGIGGNVDTTNPNYDARVWKRDATYRVT